MIGGVTPAARVAEHLVCLYDQNPQVHLPDQTIASTVEHRAMALLMNLLQFDPNVWSGVFTSGATASNVLGLALGREHVVTQAALWKNGGLEMNVASHGMLRACRLAGIEDFRVFTTMPHSSIYKAASILGLGRSNIVNVAKSIDDISFDFAELERHLIECSGHIASIVAVSCGEVNTGNFATRGSQDFKMLREICTKYGAWLHVDGGRSSMAFRLSIVLTWPCSIRYLCSGRGRAF